MAHAAYDPLQGLRLEGRSRPAANEIATLLVAAGFPESHCGRDAIERAAAFLAVYDGIRLVAYTSVHWVVTDHLLDWRDLAVDKDYRGRGIGELLGHEILKISCDLIPPGAERIKISARPAVGLAQRYRELHGFSGPADAELSRYLRRP